MWSCQRPSIRYADCATPMRVKPADSSTLGIERPLDERALAVGREEGRLRARRVHVSRNSRLAASSAASGSASLDRINRDVTPEGLAPSCCPTERILGARRVRPEAHGQMDP